MIRILITSCVAVTMQLASIMVAADSWRYPSERTSREEIFGEIRIVQIQDARKNQQYPLFEVEIYRGPERLAVYRGIAVETLVPAPDQKLFVGLSNHGIPGTAVVIFDNDANLVLYVRHGLAKFDYCEESVTLVRTWYDSKNPSVSFQYTTYDFDKETKYLKTISVMDCHGKRIDLFEAVGEAYNRTLQRTRESPRR